ncbi:hypothetical protein OH807_05450 [Kitasatospora sp. NBC_01560]|uniref:hypothetical protein n=1 Tax=Kitasatospora sp. NBC_01560 TaxID=2975965 RepID=UPI003869A011
MTKRNARKSHRGTGFAEFVTALEPVEHPYSAGVLPPVAAGGFTDAAGCRWTRARGPLDPRRAKRLVRAADAMAFGTAYDHVLEDWFPAFLTGAGRAAAWEEIREHYGSEGLPSHLAYEFTAEDGRTLLFVDTDC